MRKVVILLLGLAHGSFCCNIWGFDSAKEFRTHVPIDEPLFFGDNIHEFLKLCQDVPKPKEKDMGEGPAKRDLLSTCEHPIDDQAPNVRRMMTQLEVFYLKEAQAKIRIQRGETKSKMRAVVHFILFLIPLFMTIYLVAVGHFKIATLPILEKIKYFKAPQGQGSGGAEKSEGIKYELYTWMKYHIVPASYSTTTPTKEAPPEPVRIDSVTL